MTNTDNHRPEFPLEFGLKSQPLHARQDETRHNDTRPNAGDEADLLSQMGIFVPRD